MRRVRGTRDKIRDRGKEGGRNKERETGREVRREERELKNKKQRKIKTVHLREERPCASKVEYHSPDIQVSSVLLVKQSTRKTERGQISRYNIMHRVTATAALLIHSILGLGKRCYFGSWSQVLPGSGHGA